MDNPVQPDQNALLQELQYLRNEVAQLRTKPAAKASSGWAWFWGVIAVLILFSTCATRSAVPYTSAVSTPSSSTSLASQVPSEPTQAVEKAIDFSGSGHKATDPFMLNAGLLTVDFKHNGSSNFIVHLLDGQGNLIEGICNEIGGVDGSKAFGISAPGYYVLSINADGGWGIRLR
jgi:hypothetical protein